MAFACFNCGKKSVIGKSHTHHPGVSGQRWKKRAPKTQKIFRPNLQFARIPMGNNMKRVKLCVKCKRLYRELMNVKKEKSNQSLAPVTA